LLNETGDLDVVGGLHELNTSQSTLGDDTGAVVGLGAPGDGLVEWERRDKRVVFHVGGWVDVETNLAFDDTNLGVGLGWAPEAEVIDAVNDGSLAEGICSGSL